VTRRECLGALASAPFWGCGREPHVLRARRRGVEFLESQQHSDGSWRSRTYGLLAGGDSLTALITSTLAGIDPASEAVSRGLDYLAARRRNAPLGLADPALPDYPVFSHSLAVQACVQASDVHARDLKFLLSRQFQESAGWTPESAPYGAWGMGAAVYPPPEAGHVDLSMTRHALEALRAADIQADAEPLRRARIFVERLLHDDGGFHFSTVVPEANKAGRGADRWNSYGTAVADGIRSLEALALPSDASRIWLVRNHQRGIVSGFEHHPDARWKDGLWFYYIASAAPFLAPSQRQKLGEELVDRQAEDGSWANPEPLVKEDDPLIATPLALQALSEPARPSRRPGFSSPRRPSPSSRTLSAIPPDRSRA